MLITHLLIIKFLLIKVFFIYLYGKTSQFLYQVNFSWSDSKISVRGKQHYKNGILLFELNV